MTKASQSRPIPSRVIQRVLKRLDQSGGPDACWPCAGTRLPSGYVLIGWGEDGKRYATYAHRVVLMSELGRVIEGHERALHSCDNPPCGNPRHIFLGTPKMNNEDMAAKGRSTKGERNPQAKLTVEQVKAIRVDERSSRLVALDYDVSDRHIRKVRANVAWTHV